MGRKIGKKEMEKLKDLENQILSLSSKNDGISYSIDLGMEAKIKYSVLCEKFTKKKVDLFLAEESINIEFLADQDKYIEISRKLKEL